MTINRRSLLAGLAGMGMAASRPAWAQAIAPQNDPWAQVDPYADPRNGFAGQPASAMGPGSGAGSGGGVFQRGPRRRATPEEEQGEIADASRLYGRYMDEDGGPVADRRLHQAMQSFMAPLAGVSDRPHLPWEARVARSGAINAWALGGGKMSFNAGLIAACDHPGELAAVVAHEIGHVDNLHTLMRLQMLRTLAAADQSGMLDLGKVSAQTVVPGVGDGKARVLDLLRAGFSRDNEYEADEHSVELLRRAGIDPGWSVVVMLKLARLDHEYGHHLVSELTQSHPRASDRADNLARQVALDRSPAGAVSLPGWDVLKAAFPTPAKWRNA